MSKLKQIFSSWKIWLLLAFVVLALVAISPNPFAKGAVILSVEGNSSAEANGLEAGMVIKSLNGEPVLDAAGFTRIASTIVAGDIVTISTAGGTFKFLAEERDGAVSLGITVGEVETSNLKKGIDLAGGVRALLKPAEPVDDQMLQDIILITEKRLNTYGISDITVRQVSDLEGNDYILVEVPGANKDEVAGLLQQQGVFEARINNETVFYGDKDIKYVCRTSDCAHVLKSGCGKNGDQYVCKYEFSIDISPEAAKRHAAITSKLDSVFENGDWYLSEPLDLFLDSELTSSLSIHQNLKGSETTSISISGAGFGKTNPDAVVDAYEKMNEMQTLLISGSLPVKLEIAKMDVISPALGEDFLQVAIIALCIAILAVGIVIFIRYRSFKLALPVILTGLSEVVIILGVAAVINWRLDLAAIAGILAAVGTGVDDQIVIADEVLGGEKQATAWKKRMKHAFFIIFAAYFTTVVAMLPLWWMGAGMVKGFAVTTIIGVTIGVFITRPAFAKVIEVLLRD